MTFVCLSWCIHDLTAEVRYRFLYPAEIVLFCLVTCTWIIVFKLAGAVGDWLGVHQNSKTELTEDTAHRREQCTLHFISKIIFLHCTFVDEQFYILSCLFCLSTIIFQPRFSNQALDTCLEITGICKLELHEFYVIDIW